MVRSTAFNLVGVAGPAVVAVAAIPVLLHALGSERFGLPMLSLGVLGWFSVFDAGLGRATTRLVAVSRENGPGGGARRIALRTIAILGALGALAGAAAALVTPWLVRDVSPLTQARPTRRRPSSAAPYRGSRR